MLFRSSDLMADFDRLTRGLNLGSDLDKVFEGIAATGRDFVGSHGVDTVETPTGIEFYIDLPGIDPADVDLTIDDHTVTVSASRSFELAEDAELVQAGRRHGSFDRKFRLGTELDPESVSARSEHGVLVVSVNKTQAIAPRKVEISLD